MVGQHFEGTGVIPACLLPFTEEFEIDELAFRRHLNDVAIDGVTGIAINSHSTEVAVCTFEEQQRVLRIAMDEIGTRIPVIAGVYSESSREAERIARMAATNGASALLVFPVGGIGMDPRNRLKMVIEHHRRVADASGLPLIFFQYPAATGSGLTVESLESVIDAVPSIRAVKDYSNDPVQLLQTVRALHARASPVSVLSAHAAWLLCSLVAGCDGILSGSGSILAAQQVAILRAVQNNDLDRARTLADGLFPIIQALYGQPLIDMHNRMKNVQVMLGKMRCAAVREPLQPLGDDELANLRAALNQAAF